MGQVYPPTIIAHLSFCVLVRIIYSLVSINDQVVQHNLEHTHIYNTNDIEFGINNMHTLHVAKCDSATALTI